MSIGAVSLGTVSKLEWSHHPQECLTHGQAGGRPRHMRPEEQESKISRNGACFQVEGFDTQCGLAGSGLALLDG